MKKLVLKKTTIANLDDNAMKLLLGGDHDKPLAPPPYHEKDNTKNTLQTDCRPCLPRKNITKYCRY